MKVICSVALIDLAPNDEFELFDFAGAAQLCRKHSTIQKRVFGNRI